MAIDAFAAQLRNLDVFRGLHPLQITEIAHQAERMVFRDGQMIVEAGKPGDGAFVLVHGTAEVVDEASAPALRGIVPGSLIGEMAMLIEHDYKISVVARGSVRALKIARSTLHGQMRADPRLSEHFVARISSRLAKVAVELRRIDEMMALAAEPFAAVP